MSEKSTTPAQEATAASIDVRVYPIKEPKSNTVAFASATVNDIAMTNLRVVSGEKGLFVAMPSVKDKDGEYRDICFPTTPELRKQLNKAVLDQYAAEIEKPSVRDQIKEGASAAKEKSAAAKDKSEEKLAKKSGQEL